MNGISKSTLLVDATGTPAPVSHSWQAPAGSSPFFGWMGEEGFTTVKIDSILAITPHPQMRGRSLVWIAPQLNLIINGDDTSRLLKRMGWTEPKR